MSGCVDFCDELRENIGVWRGVVVQLIPGTLIDRYRIEVEIGRGGMARVFRVRHKNLDTLHALKVMLLGGAELRERMLREGKLQSQLDHPNIVGVRDVLDLEDGPGLLMDYIDGPSLDRWMVEQHPDAAERERVFLEIVDGVAFAHAKGVVHRDLKPSNVLMERRRGAWHPRVADFGLAKVIGSEDEQGPSHSRTGRPMGTPAYMSPEQVRSAKHVDHRADIFALGCILYELACGRRAFVGDDSLEVFNRVAHGRFVPPRELVTGLEPRVEAAVYGALAVDPNRRIPNCATLVQVLLGDVAWELPSKADVTLDGGAFSTDEVERALIVPPQEPARPAPVPTLAPPPSVPSPTASSRWGVVAAVGVVVAALGGWVLLGSKPDAAPVVDAPVPAPAAVPAVPPVVLPPVTSAPVVEPPNVAASVPVVKPVAAKSAAVRSGPPTGRVRFGGDARRVTLRGTDGRERDPGDVPPGFYTIAVEFETGYPMSGGDVEVRAGDDIKLECWASSGVCAR